MKSATNTGAIVKIVSFLILSSLLLGCTKEQKKSVDETTKDILGITSIDQIEKSKEAVRMVEEVQQRQIDALEDIE
jgi:hypothetical protein